METGTNRQRPHGGRRVPLALAILGLLAPAPAFGQGAKHEETVLGLLASCYLAVQGRVEEVVPPGPERICTAEIRVRETLKGRTQETKVWVAQELFLPSDQPSYHKGRDVILFLVPLPAYSRWDGYRSRGVAYTAAGGRLGVREFDSKAAARKAAAFLARYEELASFRTQEEKKEYLESMLEGLESRVDFVQEVAVEALVRLNDLRLLIGEKEKARLDRFIRDRAGSRTARGRLIHSLLVWQGFEPSVAAVLAEEPEMRLAVLQDVAAFGAAGRLGPGVLEACLKDPDPRVRSEAIGLVPEVADPALTAQVAEIAAGDPSAAVRVRALNAAGRLGGERGREILSQALGDSNPAIVYTAADELRRLGGEGSARKLGGLLQAADPRIRLIGILMLGSMDEAEARTLLQNASERHLDKKTRDWCRKVLDGGRLDLSSIRHDLGPTDDGP